MTSTWVCLIRIKTNEGLRSHLIDKPSFTIGRTQEADLPIVESSVSRLHLVIKLQANEIWIADQKSANGTFLNNRQLEPGQVLQIKEHDVIKLGTSSDEFTFAAIPKPFEMMGAESQKATLMASMEVLAKQLEAKARAQIEKEVRQARLELEQVKSQAKKEVEVIRTQNAVELQTRKQALDAELAKVKQNAQLAVNEERLKARREADTLIADAQQQIQKDYTESSRLIESQMQAAQIKSQELIDEANERAEAVEAQAREEVTRMRLQITEESRALKQEAMRKNSEFAAQHQERLQKELADKKTEMLNQVRIEVDRLRESSAKEVAAFKEAALEQLRAEEQASEREILSKERAFDERIRVQEQTSAMEILAKEEAAQEQIRTNLQSALEQIRVHEQKATQLSKEVDTMSREKSKLDAEIDTLESDLQAARKLLAETESLEIRRSQAEIELKEYTRTRDLGLSTIEKELHDAREKAVREVAEFRDKNALEFDAKKRDQDSRLAKERLAALDEIESTIKAQEKRYEQTRRLRALELSQKLNDRLLPKLDGWLTDLPTAKLNMKREIEESVVQSLVTEVSSIQAAPAVVQAIPAAFQEAKDRRLIRYAAVVASLLIVAFGVYGYEIYQFLVDSQKDSYAAKLIAQRKIQSIYSPSQDDSFRETYTDNVLFKKNYYEFKTDDDYIEKWTLRLNDIAFLKPLGLSEEDVVQYVSKETNLVKRLGVLRSSIDAKFLDEGLDRMRNAENEDVAAIITILKSEANLRKIRDVEKDFLKQYAAKHRKK